MSERNEKSDRRDSNTSKKKPDKASSSPKYVSKHDADKTVKHGSSSSSRESSVVNLDSESKSPY